MTKTQHKLFLLLTALSAGVYFIWRLGWTFPSDHGWVSMVAATVVLLAEIVGLFDLFALFSVGMKQPIPCPQVKQNELPDVDVFVPTCGEPTALLRQTLTACKAMDYEAGRLHIWLCDDRDREEMEALAGELGVGYLRRPTHDHAKAGNLNHALSQSHAPLVAVFDADMCPKPEFLRKTVPYFLGGYVKGGKRVLKPLGYVQTPQHFVNPDMFQRAFRAEQRIPSEQDYFYHVIEPARNHNNSVVFGGTNAVLLRKALEEAGGFATDTLTEDFATGIEIQKKGYTCLALDEVLASGLTPEDLPGLIRQRSRWARGCIQSGRRARLLQARELTWSQKVSYLSSISYWYMPVKRLIYLAAPLLYALGGVTIMRCDFKQMLIFWLPLYFLSTLGIRLLSGGLRTTHWSNVYETCLFPFLLLPVLAESLGRRKTTFEVTPKDGSRRWKWSYPLPFFVLMGLDLWGLYNTLVMTVQQQTSNYLFLLFWLAVNLYYLGYGLYFVLACRTR